MKAVVLAGGKGTRLAPYTRILPKPLIPVGDDMPILELLLRQMKRSGIDEVKLAVGHLAGLLCAFFQDGERLGLKITYSFEDKPLGTAGPLSQMSDLDDTFLVTNGDVLTTLPLTDLIEFHHLHHAMLTVASHVRRVKIDLGVIHGDGDHRIVGYTEKPTYEFLVSMGIYVFEPAVLSYIERGKYLDFPDLVLRLVNAGEKVMSYPYDGYWMDMGRFDDYEQAVKDYEALKPQLLGEAGNGRSLADEILFAPTTAK